MYKIRKRYFCRYFINELYVLLGMSDFDECEMGESLKVKQSYHLTQKTIGFFSYFTLIS